MIGPSTPRGSTTRSTKICTQTAWGPSARLKSERKDLIDWLRRKARDDKPSLALADKLEAGKPNTRCKRAACLECSHAAPQLVTPRFLEEQLSAGTICISVVSAVGVRKLGHLSAPNLPDEGASQ